jgi:Metal-dependent hydrolase involved in phosphonate metabolism
LIFTNARVVTRDRALLGTVEVVEQHIIAVYRGSTALPGAIDLGGDYLLPGLIELNTRNLCRHLMRRPHTRSPLLSALLAHDAEMISAGITTAYGRLPFDRGQSCLPAPAIGDVAALFRLAAGSGLTRADHRLSAGPALEGESVNESPRSAARGQSLPIDAQRTQAPPCTAGTVHGTAPAEPTPSTIRAEGTDQDDHPAQRPLHSTRQRRDPVVGVCPGVCEFPPSPAAARAARAANLKIMVAANSLIGHGDAVTSGPAEPDPATSMVSENLVDILSSDDYPPSLLRGAFYLYQSPLRLSLSEAIATVSATPAQVAGLTDRGEIAPGKRADLIRVRSVEAFPVTCEVWRAGERVF